MPKPKTKTTSQIVSDYVKRTYHRFDVKVRKDKAIAFRDACNANGTNPNKLINEWITEYVAPAE